MQLDTTLLDKDGAPTIEELKAFFQKHDYTATDFSFDLKNADRQQRLIYEKAKQLFYIAWTNNLNLIRKGSYLRNYSNEHPIKALEAADEKLVAGITAQLIADEQMTTQIINDYFQRLKEPITQECRAYATSQNKALDDLSEEEVSACVDKVADRFLTKMVELQMASQSVPEMVDVVRETAVIDDFGPEREKNYERADFVRQDTHMRTKVGSLLSLDELINQGYPPIDEQTEYLLLLQEIRESLDEKDKPIFDLYITGYKQKEIAMRLGYRTHSAVSKRLDIIKTRIKEFLSHSQL